METEKYLKYSFFMIMSFHLEAMEYLRKLMNSTPVNQVDLNKELYYVVEYGNSTIGVKELLQKGADGNYTLCSYTPLHIAARDGKKEIVKLLLEKNVDSNVKNNQGHTPLHLAVYKGKKDIVELLINNKADVNVQNNYGNTPLHYAVYSGNYEIIELLLKHPNIDRSLKNNEGKNAFDPAPEQKYWRKKNYSEIAREYKRDKFGKWYLAK